MVLCRGKYPVASRYEVFFDYCGKQQAQSMVNKICDSTGERCSRVDHCSGSLIEISFCIANCRKSMADPKGNKPAAVADGTSVHLKNAINVAMEDLAEEDRKEVER
jgi:hypothetical protein